MSILIKGIDLPKDTEGISITFYTADGWTETHILDVTQAIQIDRPHGRLIDGDKIEAEAKQTLYGEISYEEIATAPTILEAEE